MVAKFDRVVELVSQVFGVEKKFITPTADLTRDLGADSLDLTELAEEVEHEFHVHIPDDAIRDLNNAHGLYELIRDGQAKVDSNT